IRNAAAYSWLTYSKASRSKRSDLSAAVSGTSLTDSVIAVNDTPVLSRTAVALMDNSFCLSIRDGAHPPFGSTCATSDRGPTIPRTALMLASEIPATPERPQSLPAASSPGPCSPPAHQRLDPRRHLPARHRR